MDRWSRAYVGVSAVFLVAWQVSRAIGLGWRTQMFLAVLGFVLHIIFGKAYTLLPSYFDRSLSFEKAPAIQFPLTFVGTLLLSFTQMSAVGSALWIVGVSIFLITLLFTIRDNLTGRETGTSEVKKSRRSVDRYSNAFVPFALIYLAIGSYNLVGLSWSLPCILGCELARILHLLAVGTAVTMVFAVGFRLLPRFLVSHPSRYIVAIVLPAGAVGPALIAAHLNGGLWFRIGASLEAIAVIGFGMGYLHLMLKSERRRMGFYGVLAGVVCGAIGVLIGVGFAFGVFTVELRGIHARLNLLGFLGLTIIGVAYQFYPPNVGSFWGADNRVALVSIGLIFVGLIIEPIGVASNISVSLPATLLTLLGSIIYAYLVLGLFYIHGRR